MGALQFPSLDAAIAKFENVNPAFNNPGGITQATANYYWPGATSAAGPGTSCPGCAVFPSYEAGTQAQDAIVSGLANSGYSLADFIAKYSGAQGDTLNNYVKSVSQDTGIAPSAPANSANASAPSSPGFWQSVMMGLGGGYAAGKQASGKQPDTCSLLDIPCHFSNAGFSFGRIVAVVLGLGLVIIALARISGTDKMIVAQARTAAIAA